jgi:hypothetical protein
MKRLLFIVSFIFLTIFSACSDSWRRKLNIERLDYNGNELKIQGFYYNKNFATFILFKNGVTLGWLRVGNTLNDVINYWTDKNSYGQHVDSPRDWGIYQISKEIFKSEGWYANGEILHPIGKHIGRIVNDTTLLITEAHFPPQHTVENDTFYFYPLSIKPDSTNRFIK